MSSFLSGIFAPRQLRALTTLLAALLAIAEMLGVLVLDTAVTPRGQPLNLSGYALVFEDDFNGSELDMQKWAYRGSGPRSGGFIANSQVFLDGGDLVLRAEYLEDGAYGAGWYSGMIRSVEDFTSGYFEARCLVSRGGGFWSAFWLNSPGMASAEASNGGIGGAEIDIFEAGNYDNALKPNSVTSAIHVGGYGDGLRSELMGSFKVNKPYTTYNLYGLEWTQEEYIFYINGVETVRSTFKDGVSRGLEYIIFSLEPPREFTEQPGFSCDFRVDYVRVYQKTA